MYETGIKTHDLEPSRRGGVSTQSLVDLHITAKQCNHEWAYSRILATFNESAEVTLNRDEGDYASAPRKWFR